MFQIFEFSHQNNIFQIFEFSRQNDSFEISRPNNIFKYLIFRAKNLTN